MQDYSGWYATPADAVAAAMPKVDGKALPPPLSEEDKEAAAAEADLASKGFPYQAGRRVQCSS